MYIAVARIPSVHRMGATPTMLLDELAALDPERRPELAAALRGVAETFAEVRDGKTAAWMAPLHEKRCTRPYIAVAKEI